MVDNKPILIITADPDPHVDRVTDILQKDSIYFVKFVSNKLSEGNYLKASSPNAILFATNSNEINLNNFRSIWYRKPEFWWNDYSKILKEEGLKITYKFNETISLIRNLMYFAESIGIYTISYLSKIRLASNKLIQLNIAKQIGFNVPQMIISSNKNDLFKFLLKNPSSITKSISEGEIIFGKYYMNMYTSIFDIKNLDNLNDNMDYPIFLQENIQKKIELRVVVVENNIFSVSIDSQSNKKSRIDWRKIDPYKMKHKIYELPENIKIKCIRMCKLLGIKFAAIDMAIDHYGNYIFFELNPNGQWLWLEEITKLPISESIASALKQNYSN